MSKLDYASSIKLVLLKHWEKTIPSTTKHRINTWDSFDEIVPRMHYEVMVYTYSNKSCLCIPLINLLRYRTVTRK